MNYNYKVDHIYKFDADGYKLIGLCTDKNIGKSFNFDVIIDYNNNWDLNYFTLSDTENVTEIGHKDDYPEYFL